jgi:cytochrome c-type biogenesis protein CcmH
MFRLRNSVLLFALAAACLPQSSTTLVTSDIRRVGDKLACKCGSCNNTVATCQMLECHYSSPAREKIAELQKAGMSDTAIVDNFVKERGIVALAQPPAEGFNMIGYIMPFVAIAIGVGAIGVYMKRYRAPQPVPELPSVDLKLHNRYHERIEKELAELD